MAFHHRHIIQKLTLEVDVEVAVGHVDANHWLTGLRSWLEMEFLPRLEALLDEMFPAQSAVLRLEKLALDIGTLGHDFFEKPSSIPLDALLSKAFEGKTQPFASALPPGESLQQALFHFLQFGRLPWWADVAKPFEEWEEEWMELVENQRIKWVELRELLFADSARRRLVGNFSKKFKLAVMEAYLFSEGKKSHSPSTETGFEKKETDCEDNYWLNWLESAIKRGTPHFNEKNGALEANFTIPKNSIGIAEEMPQGEREIELDKREIELGKSEIELTNEAFQWGELGEVGSANSDSKPASINADPIYLKNAGLVLVYPFIEMFFENMGISKNGQLEQPEKAVQLLHQLSVGRTGVEYEMPLNKLLCGIHPDEFVATDYQLIDAEKMECEHLLKAVIGHWSALGDASLEGLQGTFLCRDGKLSLREDGNWLLQVEQRGFDVLLEQLPWAISIIKLPWMPSLLFVEWT